MEYKRNKASFKSNTENHWIWKGNFPKILYGFGNTRCIRIMASLIACKFWTNPHVPPFFLKSRIGVFPGELQGTSSPWPRNIIITFCRPSLALGFIWYYHLFGNLLGSFSLIMAGFARWAWPGVPIAQCWWLSSWSMTVSISSAPLFISKVILEWDSWYLLKKSLRF